MLRLDIIGLLLILYLASHSEEIIQYHDRDQQKWSCSASFSPVFSISRLSIQGTLGFFQDNSRLCDLPIPRRMCSTQYPSLIHTVSLNTRVFHVLAAFDRATCLRYTVVQDQDSEHNQRTWSIAPLKCGIVLSVQGESTTIAKLLSPNHSSILRCSVPDVLIRGS